MVISLQFPIPYFLGDGTKQYREVSIHCLNGCDLRPDLQAEIGAEYWMVSEIIFQIVGDLYQKKIFVDLF